MTDETRAPQSADKKRFPVALGIGLVAAAIALTVVLTGGDVPVLFAVVAVVGISVGLIQQSIERGRSTP